MDNRLRDLLTATAATGALIAVALVSYLNLLLIVGIGGLHYLGLSRRYGHFVVASVVAVAIAGVVAGSGFVTYLGLAAVLPAVVLSVCRSNGMSVAVSLSAGTIIPVVGIALYHSLFLMFLKLYSDQLKQLVTNPQFMTFYPPTQVEKLTQAIAWWADKAPYYLPAGLLFLIMGYLCLGMLGGEYLFKDRGVASPVMRPFSQWKLSPGFFIPLAVATVFALIGSPILQVIGWNGLLFLSVLCSVFGLSLLEHWMRARQLPAGVRVLVYLFLFLTQIIAAVILPLLALFDAHFDFRKIRAKALG